MSICRMLRQTIIVLGLGCTLGADGQQTETTLLRIAHRGGVVDEKHAENSPAGVRAAIESGYWMLEVDIRESRDGRLVVHHDRDFRRFYGDERLLAELTWDEIRKLRATPGDSRPMLFEELAALCHGKVRLMLDTKPPDHPPAFYASMAESLQKHELLESAFVIGTDESKAFFKSRARIGVNRKALRLAAEKGEDVSRLYFLFEHGRDLDREAIALARRLDVPVVASVNIFHYEDTDHRKAARADIRRLKRDGVTYFQIDSVYDAFVLDE